METASRKILEVSAEKVITPTAAIGLKIGVIKPSHLVEIAYRPFTEQYVQKEISVDFNIPYTLPDVYCDVAKTTWVLSIFFSNAVRYTPEWGKLSVKAELLATQLRITVENTGYGVPLERLQRMFERSENYDSPEFGQGLALVLAREIIEAHGGTIGVTSELGVMTQFFITIPIEDLSKEQV
ncbi:MAG: HAMP domain-containing histidine kinase [Spirochaetes bacterium]|nr:HAMP domain-containing histidine kinase [Spirochaetota bacterium]